MKYLLCYSSVLFLLLSWLDQGAYAELLCNRLWHKKLLSAPAFSEWTDSEPGKECNNVVKKMPSEKILSTVFRYYTTPENVEWVKKNKRLIAQSNHYAHDQFYYQDLSGVILSPTNEKLSNLRYVDPKVMTSWIDVKLDSKELEMMQLNDDAFLIPGAPPSPSWLVDAVKKSFLN